MFAFLSAGQLSCRKMNSFLQCYVSYLARQPCGLGTIHILRQQKDWVGGFKKLQFLDNDEYCIYADYSEWVVHKRCKDVLT